MYALAGAFFAALVSVITKPALEKIDVTIGMLVQGVCMVGVFLILATVLGRWPKAAEAPGASIALMALAGTAAGLAWFCGYRALKLSSVAQATPVDRLSLALAVVLAMVFLGERPTATNWAGIALILVGVICVAQSGKSVLRIAIGDAIKAYR